MTAALLPSGKLQFEDINGAPLVGGKVFFYFPNTFTPKDTWQDASQSILNTNPVILDSRGQAVIWGSGAYRQILKDADDNQIWDQVAALPTLDSVGAMATDFSNRTADLVGTGVTFIQSGGDAVTRTAQAKMRDVVTPEDFGAVGDGVADDGPAILAALNTGALVRGNPGKIYGVSGSASQGIVCPSVARFSDVFIKDLLPGDPSRRTIYQQNGSVFSFERGGVDRNGTGGGGTIASAAAIYVDTCPDVRIVDAEITGDDMGTGIVVTGCNGPLVKGCRVHDMGAGTSGGAAPTDDVLQGIWFISCSQPRCENNTVKNLLVQWSGQPPTNRWSRGIVNSGCDGLVVVGNTVVNVDQGNDNSGDLNPRRTSVVGNSFSNLGSFGVKFANTGTYSTVMGNTIDQAGLAGVVISGNTTSTPQSSQIIVEGNVITRTGKTTWAAFNIAGVSIQTGGAPNTAFPQGVKVIGNIIDGTGSASPMKFGVNCDVDLPTASGDIWNVAENNTIIGSSVAAIGDPGGARGIADGYARVRRSANQAIPNNAFGTFISFDTIDVDRMGSMPALGTDIICRRRGNVIINGMVQFLAGAGTTRQVRLVQNGTPLIGAQASGSPNAATALTLAFAFIAPVNAGDVLRIDPFQDSGGNLNATCVTSVRYVAFSRGLT